MDPIARFRDISDKDLLARLDILVKEERRQLVSLLACLGEFDRRKLYADEGFPHLFAYCVAKLRCSEGAAARRVHACRAARRFPEIYSMISEGWLSLTAVSMLAPHLTEENHDTLLAGSQGMSRLEMQKMLVGLAPHSGILDRITWVTPPAALEPSRDPTEAGQAPSERTPTDSDLEAVKAAPGAPMQEPSAPTAPPMVRFHFTATEAFLRRFERARDLLRHKHPDGLAHDVFDEALEAFLDRKDPERRIRRKTQERSERPDAAMMDEPVGTRLLTTWSQSAGPGASTGREPRRRPDA